KQDGIQKIIATCKKPRGFYWHTHVKRFACDCQEKLCEFGTVRAVHSEPVVQSLDIPVTGSKQFVARKPVGDFERRGLFGIGAVDRVLLNGRRELLADC